MTIAAFLALAALGQSSGALEVGETVAGEIGADAVEVHSPTLDANYTQAPTVGKDFQVQVAFAGAFTFELRSYDFDAYLVLQTEDGTLIGEDDDSLIAQHSRLVVKLEAAQTYTVRACALHGARGKFELTFVAGVPETVTPESQFRAEEADFFLRLAHYEIKFGEQSVEYANAQLFLGNLYYNQGNLALAEEQWQSSLAIFEQVLGSEHAQTATLLNNLAMLFGRQGKFRQSLEYHQRALGIREKVLGPVHAETGASLNNLATLYESQGMYEQALPLYQRAVDVWKKVYGEEHLQTAIGMSNYATVLRRQGAYQEALPLYEKAVGIIEESLGPDHPHTGTSLSNLATLLDAQGKFDQGLPLHQRALSIWEAAYGPDHPQTAAGLNHLGTHYYFVGASAEAQPLLERSLAIRQKVYGALHPETATSRNNLANLYLETEDYEKALPLLKQALEAMESTYGPEHPEAAAIQNNIASVFEDLKDFDEAGRRYQRAVEIWENSFGVDNPKAIAGISNLAKFHLAHRKHDAALPLFQRALGGTLRLLDRELPTMTEAGRLRLLKFTADPEPLLQCAAGMDDAPLKDIYSQFQQWKGKATRLQAASVQMGQTADSAKVKNLKADIQSVAATLSGLVLLPLANQADDHEASIAELRQHRLRLEGELNRALGLDLVLAAPSIGDVQRSLSPDSVLLDFYVGDFVYAWVLKQSGDPQLIALGKSDALQQAQAAYLKVHAVRGGRSLSANTSKDPAADLYAKLWHPVQDAVGDAKTILLCPDGMLCELPFGILKQSDGTFLLEKHRFVYLSDPTQPVASTASAANDEGSLLVVGGVNYFRRDDVGVANASGPSTRSRVGDSWSSLPATRDEVQSLRDLHEYVLEWTSPLTVVEGKAATEERIRAALPGQRYVHIATHGYFEPDHLPSLLLDAQEEQSQTQLGQQKRAVGMLPGLLSGLVFAGVNGEFDPSRDDGYLSAEEIQHLDLSACDLVVLSACETALGSARAGEGLMSLRRAFSVAGADTVVSSLWKVDDQATAQLMKDFYANLWEKGMSRGQALHEAKLRMLRRNRIDHNGDAKLSTWGAFVLSGKSD